MTCRKKRSKKWSHTKVIHHDNLFDEMGAWERFFTFIQMLVIFAFGLLSLYILLKFESSYLLIQHGRLSDSYYSYYEERYDDLENILDQMIEQNQMITFANLPIDVMYQSSYENNVRRIVFSLDEMEDISMEYEVNDKDEIVSKTSHKLDSEDFYEQAYQSFNASMGFTLILVCLTLLCLGYTLSYWVMWFIYVLEVYQEF